MTEFSTMMNPLTLEKSPGNDGQEEAMRGISDNLVAVQQKLDKLLATKDRPNISGSFSRKTCVRQVTVNLSINILRIENIDVPNQEFTTEFDLYVSWFQGERLETKQDIISDQNEWNPEIYFPNATHMDMIQKISSPETNDGCSEILYRVKGKFRCIFNFQDFPFDYQMLRIFVSSRWNRNIVQFRQDPEVQSCISLYNDGSKDEQFKLEKVVSTGVSYMERREFSDLSTYSMCTFEVPIQRRQWLFIANHIPSIILVVILALVVFAVPITLPGHRLFVVAVLLLATVVYKHFLHAHYLPLSYIVSFFDKYCAACLVFICIIGIETGIAAAITSSSTRASFDLAFFIILLIVCLLYHIAFAIAALRKAREVALKLNDFREYYSNLLRGTTLPREKEDNGVTVEVNESPEVEEITTPIVSDVVEAANIPSIPNDKNKYSRFSAFNDELKSAPTLPPPVQAKAKTDLVKLGHTKDNGKDNLSDENTHMSSTPPRLSSFGARYNPYEMTFSKTNDPLLKGKQETDIVVPQVSSEPEPNANILDAPSFATYDSFNPLSSLSRQKSLQASDTDDGDESKRMKDGSSVDYHKPEYIYQQPKDSFRFEREPSFTESNPNIADLLPPDATYEDDKITTSETSKLNSEPVFQSPRLSAFYQYGEPTAENTYVIPRYPSLAIDDDQVSDRGYQPYDAVPVKVEPTYSYPPPSPGAPPKLTTEVDAAGVTKIEPIYVYNPHVTNADIASPQTTELIAGDDVPSVDTSIPSGGEPLYSTVPMVPAYIENGTETESRPHDVKYPLLSRPKTKSKDRAKASAKTPTKTKVTDYPASDGWL